MVSEKVVNLKDIHVACSQCSLYQLCLPAGLDDKDMNKLDQMVGRSQTIHRGETLYQAGNQLKSLFAIRSGCFKSTYLADDGEEQIIGFHLPGELVGLDAISNNEHKTTVEALDTGSTCELPFASLQQLAHELPSLNLWLLRIMSKEIGRESNALQLMGNKNAAGRMAAFLVNLSERLGERKLSVTEFNMMMSRHEIANYLGLAVETVSRILGQFQDEQIIKVKGRLIEILDLPGLYRLAGRDDNCVRTHTA